MKEIILLVIALLLGSCNTKRTAQNEPVEKRVDSVENRTSEPLVTALFTDFFERFMWDPEFQRSRIVVPLKRDGHIITTVNDWEHIPFYAQNDYIPLLASDTLTLYDTDVKTLAITLSLIDFENNTAVQYEFQSTRGQWFLFGVETVSLVQEPDHEFIGFLKAFSEDLSYQTDHIRFPLAQSYADPENDYQKVTTSLAKEDWEFRKFTEDIRQLMVLSHQEIELPLRNIFFRGLENGIWVKYTFEKIHGTWQLIRLEDYST